jgi:hypothetical protein
MVQTFSTSKRPKTVALASYGTVVDFKWGRYDALLMVVAQQPTSTF